MHLGDIFTPHQLATLSVRRCRRAVVSTGNIPEQVLQCTPHTAQASLQARLGDGGRSCTGHRLLLFQWSRSSALIRAGDATGCFDDVFAEATIKHQLQLHPVDLTVLTSHFDEEPLHGGTLCVSNSRVYVL